MHYDLNQFKGVIVALNSCFDSNDAVDVDATQRLCRFYAGLDLKGLYVCGSTGEGLLMTVEERKLTLETVMNELLAPSTTTTLFVAPAPSKPTLSEVAITLAPLETVTLLFGP